MHALSSSLHSNHIVSVSPLKLYKVRLQDEPPGVTVEGEFILFDYSSYLEEAEFEIAKLSPAHLTQHNILELPSGEAQTILALWAESCHKKYCEDCKSV